MVAPSWNRVFSRVQATQGVSNMGLLGRPGELGPTMLDTSLGGLDT